MSDLDKRIAQFQNMAQADPDNEMAHFSLAGALVQAGRHAEAAESYLRCTELAPTMSKAYQLGAEALLAVGDKERAGQIAIRGYTIAAERGDLMPKRALAELLERLGKPVPEVASKGAAPSRDVSLLGNATAPSAPAGPFPPGSFIDHKTGRPGTKMPRPPFKGPVGEWIFEHISRETFDDWIRQGTKVINELRLDLSREQDAETYDQHMREYLGIDEALYERLSGGR
ncbi:MAG: Fe(2+)-trafficking protein [Phycisphaeraceae bacterium]|nr:Fe(2+)-trafficking protein [Phycisphaeraceae bacterium]